MLLDSIAPAVASRDETLHDEHLDDVLKAWPKPLPSHWEMQPAMVGFKAKLLTSSVEGRRVPTHLEVC